MRFISTRGQTPPVPLGEALLSGLASDGGLFMPESIPRLREETLAGLPGEEWPALCFPLAEALLGTDLPPDAVRSAVQTAFSFPIPFVKLGDRLHVLELHHGPTLAFKDFGARFMAELLRRFLPAARPRVTILTATSGDTGGAVAHAFHGVPGVRVVVLFPEGKVTARQERQFSTLGGNVSAVAVQGDFDDCQRLAKEAFQTPALREGLRLTSANSINVGRFLPQSFYYFFAWSRLAGQPEELLFSVPSGNLGNLAAGLLALRMGLPGVRLLSATNANDGFVAYLRSGRFQPGPSVRTLSTAMDVGNPSNLERIRHLYPAGVEVLRQDLTARSVTDRETRACIRRVADESGYVLDPHSAVGYCALEQELSNRPRATGVLLATAHPAKFAEVVEPIIGHPIPLPPALARCLEKPPTVTPIPPKLEALREFLLTL